MVHRGQSGGLSRARRRIDVPRAEAQRFGPTGGLGAHIPVVEDLLGLMPEFLPLRLNDFPKIDARLAHAPRRLNMQCRLFRRQVFCTEARRVVRRLNARLEHSARRQLNVILTEHGRLGPASLPRDLVIVIKCLAFRVPGLAPDATQHFLQTLARDAGAPHTLQMARRIVWSQVGRRKPRRTLWWFYAGQFHGSR